MPNGNPNLDDYFPAGSTAADSIKTRINSGGGTLQTNSHVLTLEDLKTIRDEDRKRSRINLAVTIILALIGIAVSIIII